MSSLMLTAVMDADLDSFIRD